MRTQFNVRIEKTLAKRTAIERKTTSTTNDIVVEVALENWFSKYSPEQRLRYYMSHARKPYAKAA